MEVSGAAAAEDMRHHRPLTRMTFSPGFRVTNGCAKKCRALLLVMGPLVRLGFPLPTTWRCWHGEDGSRPVRASAIDIVANVVIDIVVMATVLQIPCQHIPRIPKHISRRLDLAGQQRRYLVIITQQDLPAGANVFDKHLALYAST